MTSKTKQDAKPFCSCGCGQRTKGGTFKMGHDQRLRGLLGRAEALAPAARAFVNSQPKTSEWRTLQREGGKRVAERAEKISAREAAKTAARAARAKAKGKKAKKVRKVRKAVPVTPETMAGLTVRP